jgi:hypothetical protein
MYLVAQDNVHSDLKYATIPFVPIDHAIKCH